MQGGYCNADWVFQMRKRKVIDGGWKERKDKDKGKESDCKDDETPNLNSSLKKSTVSFVLFLHLILIRQHDVCPDRH